MSSVTSPVNAASAGDCVLRLRDVSVQWGAVHALRGVTLDIRRGDVTVLVGANGSGKTTLLRALHGLIPFSGTRQVAPTAGRQAMVFQRPFMLNLSARNNLRLALWLAGMPQRQRQRDEMADAALQRVGLADCANRSARALSCGQQQRLALARAWAVRPDILFLDEPTASLDPSAKNEVEALLAGFAAEGMTLVMSTHNLGQAKRLGTRVVYLEQGTVHVDLPNELFFSGGLTDAASASPSFLQFLKGELPWFPGS